jgi:WD40 repeat protein
MNSLLVRAHGGLTVAASLLVLLPGAAGIAHARQRSSCVGPAAHLLDFRVGTWDYRADGYDPGRTVVTREGTGCAFMERYVDINGGHSTSLFVLDSATGAWRVTTDDPSGHSVMMGRPEKNGIAFYHSATDREVYLPRDRDHAVFLGERSPDGGRTWKAWVTATYARVRSAAGVAALPSQPELIGPGVISTRDYERDAALAPDGKTLFFTKRTIWPYFSVICVSHLVNGQWAEPDIAPFSGRWPDTTPAIAPNGKTLYFASRRPVDTGGPLRRDYDLWAVDRTATGWSEPRHLSAPVNSDKGNELSPSATADGVLYFVTDRVAAGVVRSAPAGGGWEEPVTVAAPGDTTGFETGAFVSADERFMVVTVIGRDDALSNDERIYPRGDLYVRERHDGHWSALRHLPAPINSAAEELSPSLTADGRLLFASERGAFTDHGPRRSTTDFEGALHAPGNGLGDLFAIDARVAGISP